MTNSTLHIGGLKQPVPENMRYKNMMEEAINTYGYIKLAQEQADKSSHLRDSFEKAAETIESMYGCYTDTNLVKGMPKSTFGDRFGWDMQEDIYRCMKKFYEGKMDQDELEEYFRLCCTSMRLYRTQQHQTSGRNEDDNKQILEEVYNVFAKNNMIAARNANYNEGTRMNLSYGGQSDDWTYYNADYYYQCEETRDTLRKMVENVAATWKVFSFDTQDVEKKSVYTLDGGLDFNSGWNFCFRNQVGRSSLTEEGMVPPKGFKMFFKESLSYAVRGEDVDCIGALEVLMGENHYKREFAFKTLRTGLEGQIYTADELMKEGLAESERNSDILKFLSNLSVFTRWYSFRSGIVDKVGDYTPSEIKRRGKK